MEQRRTKAERLDRCLSEIRRSNPSFEKDLKKWALDLKMQELSKVLEIAEDIGWQERTLVEIDAWDDEEVQWYEKRIKKLRKRLRKAVSELR